MSNDTEVVVVPGGGEWTRNLDPLSVCTLFPLAPIVPSIPLPLPVLYYGFLHPIPLTPTTPIAI